MSTTDQTVHEEMIPLSVPRKHYPVMVSTLAGLMQGDALATKPSVEDVPWPTAGEEPRTDDIDWAVVDNCRRLQKHLKNVAALTMLDMAASKPGEPVYISMVMEKLGCSHGQASSGNGALTKAIRMVFNSKSEWPAPFSWDKDKQVACYAMTEAVAAAWLAAKA